MNKIIFGLIYLTIFFQYQTSLLQVAININYFMSLSHRYNSSKPNYNQDTPDMSSGRSSHEVAMLKHQVKQLLIQLEMKDQQIFFSQNQLKSTTDENVKRITILQTSLHEAKKQLAQIRHQSLKSKRLQNQKSQQSVKQIKNGFQARLKQESLQYEELLAQNQIKHKKQLDQISYKYQKIINLNKYQRQTLEHMLNDIKNSNRSHQKVLTQKNNKLTDEKIELSKQLQIMKERCEDLKSQLHTNQLQLKNCQTENKRQINLQKSKYHEYQNLVEKLKNQIQQMLVNQSQQKQKYRTQVEKLKFQLDKYKKLLQLKDSQSLSQVSEDRLNSARSIAPQIHITQQRHCSHEGYLKQLQKAVALKDLQIQELKLTIKKWQDSIGFNKKLETRVKQVGQVSNRTLKAYNTQKQMIQNHYKKL